MVTLMGKIPDDVKEAAAQMSASDAVMAIGRDRFDDPDLIEHILAKTPAENSILFDVRIVITECLANILRHGDCTALIVAARKYSNGLRLQFTHIPPLPPVVRDVIERSRTEALPDLDDPTYLGTGLGYPLMTRLCRHVTLSADNACLEFSFEPAA